MLNDTLDLTSPLDIMRHFFFVGWDHIDLIVHLEKLFIHFIVFTHGLLNQYKSNPCGQLYTIILEPKHVTM